MGAKDKQKIKVRESIEKVNRLMTKVNIKEDMEKVQIQVEFHGYKFKGEHLDVQVVNDDILVVKAEDGNQKFVRQFKLSSQCNLNKIESKFDTKEEDKQTLNVTIPKGVKMVQVPIAMDED